MTWQIGGLRKKVFKYFLFIIIIVVFLFESLFIIFINMYYYSSVRQSLTSMYQNTRSMYNVTSVEDVSFIERAENLIETQYNTQNTKIAVTIIDRNRNIVLDQYGFRSKDKSNYIDVSKALQNSENLKTYVYNEQNTGEKVMSISTPILVNGIVDGAIRFSVSMKYVDIEIMKMAFYFILVGIFILILTVGLSLKFADSIIGPLTELKIFSNMLAKGNYNIKMNKEKISDDEIGDLARTFENMAQEIQKSDKLKDEFISSISHELRTPLTSINGWSETLKLDNVTNEEIHLGLNIIDDETQRLIKLVEELLDFSRLSNSRIKLNIGEVNVETLVSSVVNQLRTMAVNKNIRLSFEFLNQNMDIIYGDINRLRQVLINLIQNSIKFTPEQGNILVSVNQFSQTTEVTVKDDGIGIEEKNVGKVSKKFFQEDFNKAGSGLGLAISDEIVKLHGGKIIIRSKKNLGTEITFTIKNDSRIKVQPKV